MSPARIYRLSIWLPLVVPVALIAFLNIAIKGLGLPAPSGMVDVVLEAIAYSAIYGGLPYLLLAAWASWWIRERPESDIRRLMYVAPLLMVGVFGTICLVMGMAVDRLSVWLSVAGLGICIIIPLGYSYVLLAVLLRRWLGPRMFQGAN